jgi:Xaa-Pro aminopeptidase
MNMAIRERLEKLRNILANRSVDGLLVTSAVNRRYLSGFTGSSGYLLITRDEAVLLSDFRYKTQAPSQAPEFVFVEHGLIPEESIRDKAAALGIRTLAYEDHDLTVAGFRKLADKLADFDLVPAGKLVETIRMVKDDGELAVMKEACAIADRAFEHMLNALKPGMTEKEAALELEFFMRREGASGTSFDTIIASGERSALPHGKASDRVMGPGEFVTLDFGAYFEGYCSDITRTVVLGPATDRHKEIYDIVLEAQLATLDGIRSGMTGREADRIARDIITKYGYGDLFGHGTGHGVGLEIHEEPRLSKGGDIVLEPGMTVTVEPGIYIPGFGGVRIEDDIVVTENGVQLLTHAPKNFIVIG